MSLYIGFGLYNFALVFNQKIVSTLSQNEASSPPKNTLSTLIVASIGVVFGDIGTSPLYSLKEAFNPVHGIPLSPTSILGVLSLLFWAIVIVVGLKYVIFVMRADNHGEGGVLALMALSLRGFNRKSRLATWLMMLGVFGACMFYGDAVITPAISVLSAVEGLQLVTPRLAGSVLPITVVVLILLFWLQQRGTHIVGKLFGPIMLLWFATLAFLGIAQIIHTPAIISALNPLYGIRFMAQHGAQTYAVLGSVVLVLTGAEALYADIGHFGARPIRFGWYSIVMPALILNYFGQGALLLSNPRVMDNPFYHLVPHWGLLPLVILATLATVIASQAVISGAFSLTSQAVQMGFAPRMKISHTSAHAIGQIYIPLANWLLLAIIICIVLSFKNSDSLAAAYGIAVTTTMVITTVLASAVMIKVWRWSKWLVVPLIAVFITIDLGFFGANLLKIKEGGWLPLMLGGALFFLLMTWFKGRQLVKARSIEAGIALQPFLQNLLTYPPHRVSGTAIYLTGNIKEEGEVLVPVSLMHNLKHNKVLHERTFFMTFFTHDVPYISEKERIKLEELGAGLAIVRVIYGFKETPDVQKVLQLLNQQHQLGLELMDTSFFLARETVVPTELRGMSIWRERLFAWMHRNAAKPSDFFHIPANRVVELGTKIEI